MKDYPIYGHHMDKDQWEQIKIKESFNTPEGEITIADMLSLFGHRLIGEIEFRNWLEELYPSFSKARRNDIDEWLEEEGDRLAQEQKARAYEEEEPEEE